MSRGFKNSLRATEVLKLRDVEGMWTFSHCSGCPRSAAWEPVWLHGVDITLGTAKANTTNMTMIPRIDKCSPVPKPRHQVQVVGVSFLDMATCEVCGDGFADDAEKHLCSQSRDSCSHVCHVDCLQQYRLKQAALCMTAHSAFRMKIPRKRLMMPQDAFPRWCWVWNLAGQFLLWCAIHGSVAPLAGGCDLSCSLWLHRECMLWMCWHLVAAGCSGIWPSKAVWRWQRPGRCAADSLALQAWFTRRWWARYSFLWRGGCHLPAACSTRRM